MSTAIQGLAAAPPITAERPSVPPTQTQALLRQVRADLSAGQERQAKGSAEAARPDEWGRTGAGAGVNITA